MPKYEIKMMMCDDNDEGQPYIEPYERLEFVEAVSIDQANQKAQSMVMKYRGPWACDNTSWVNRIISVTLVEDQ